MAELNITPVGPITPVATVPTIPTTPAISNTPYTAPVTPTIAAQTLNAVGINPNDVLSAGNIAQTINAPAPAPDDILGIRNQLYEEGGVNAAQQASQAAQVAASQAALGLNQRLTGLAGRAVSLSKITGTQAQERAVSQGEINALNESARLAANDYAAKKSNADDLFQIRNQEISEKKNIMLQFPGAGIAFGDSMEQVTKKLDKYADDQKKDAYKDTLKETALSLGLKTSGSTKDLEKRIRKANAEALNSAKEEHNLRMQGLQADINRTISGIGKGGGNSGGQESLDFSNKGVSNMIDQEVNSGASWQEIAELMEAVSPNSTIKGGTIDKYLRYKFFGENNPFATENEWL
jgi:hypothetical protein